MEDCARNALSFSLIRDAYAMRIDEASFENRFSFLMENRTKNMEIMQKNTFYFYYLNQEKCNENEGNEVKIQYFYNQFMKGKQQEIYAKIIFE